MPTKNHKKKVYVAMSGGVDSSVSAALLCKKGYDVTGVFIKAWQPDFIECTWKEDRYDAMRVASILGIPFKTFDLEKEYKKNVIDYMLKEYSMGRTPNPDVICNERIKFGEFYKKAKAEGADFIATGHYARIRKKNNKYALYCGLDKEKDQSYFLWKIKQPHLSNTMFPIGSYKKKEVRALAKKFNLPVAYKKDSQGLCFVGKLDFKDFLKRYIKTKKGNVINTKNEIIGIHDGVELYTIGQRHGFIITKKTPNDKPFYVIGKNIKTNELIVSDKVELLKKGKKEIFIDSVNWIRTSPVSNKKYFARLRYRQKLQKCSLIKKTKDKYKVIFEKPQHPAQGQSFVLYDGAECMGGGIIS